ncbi:MAG: hypothetical protein ACPGXK_12195 [Phycisphaerae bacterium]
MPSSWRRFDVQAKYAATLAVVSVLPFLASVIVAVRNYKSDIGRIIYQNSTYAMVLLGCAATAMGLAAIAVILGFNSAGQRINERQNLSWLGFFLGGGVLTLSFIVVIAFMMLRLSKPG